MWIPRVPSQSRRAVLRGAAAGAAGVALAPLLSACSTSAGAKTTATPTVANPTTILHFAPNWQGASWNKTALTLNQQFFDSNYSPQNPGVRVVVNNGSVQGGASTQIAASIAGAGFLDVFQDCCGDLPVLQQAGLLQPLDSYLRQDNIDTSLWPAGHIQVLTFNGHLLALPAYDGPCVIFYRQDTLDNLGLSYPDASWDYKTATTLWASCVGKNAAGRTRGGCSVFDGSWYEQINWWLHGWGATEMSSDRTVATFGSQQAMDMATYVQTNAAANIITPRSDVSVLTGDTAAFKQSGGWELLPAALSLGVKYKWDILPVPQWPAGRSTFNNIDFYVLNAASKNLDAAWNLLKYVCAEPDYQRFQMQATLVQPCLLSLWDEWESIVVSTAPLLKSKAISWFKDAATGGYAWPNLFFQYQAVQADNVIDNWMGQVEANKVSPQQGLAQLQLQASALQQTGAAEQAAGVTNAKAFPTNGTSIAAVVTGI
ncbi:MAG TPA: extracellular solute-binding protein [Bacillota bacterium]|nr:extracellular solute-binding protein [Bacillota bacterium]